MMSVTINDHLNEVAFRQVPEPETCSSHEATGAPTMTGNLTRGYQVPRVNRDCLVAMVSIVTSALVDRRKKSADRPSVLGG
jgi:hypothetical protein